jgi:hypothetical protein
MLHKRRKHMKKEGCLEIKTIKAKKITFKGQLGRKN